MDILDIPGEVIADHLLPWFTLNELLRLRRVCKVLKILAQDYIRLHVRSEVTQLVIHGTTDGYVDVVNNLDEKTVYKTISMETLLRMELHAPATRFHFQYDWRKDIFEKGADSWKLIPKFLERFGKQVTHLRMSSLSAPMSCLKQNSFYESLPNLVHLTVDSLQLRPLRGTKSWTEKAESHFPSTFKGLKHLEMMSYIVPCDSLRSCRYIWKMIDFCEKVEFLGFPEFSDRDVDDGADENYDEDFYDDIDPPSFGTFSFNYLRTLLRVRRARAQGGPVALKCFDMGAMDVLRLNSTPTTDAFLELCEALTGHNVKVVNAKADFLYDLDRMFGMPRRAEERLAAVNTSVVSLNGLSVHWLKEDLPLVRKIVLQTAYSCSLQDPMGIEKWEQFGIPEWSSLEELELTVNSKALVDGNEVSTLFDILFGYADRPRLVDLKFKFEEYTSGSGLAEIPVPSMEEVVLHCFNLRRLTITSWNGTNKALVELWEGLPLLEEVTLEACEMLGNVAFVGKDTKKPVFLKLKELKKLSLLSLDKMPKITDTVFDLVFRHLPLQELHLTCDDRTAPLKSVTEKGIRSLLSGEFWKTIRRFPFDRWSVAGMNHNECNKLRDQFRCSLML